MNDKEDGGPAFPVTSPVMGPSERVPGALDKIGEKHELGLSACDYFAAHAPEMPEWFRRRYNTMDDMTAVVKWRWYYASEMIQERETTCK